MKQVKLTFVLLIICINAFSQETDTLWTNANRSISIYYKQNWISIKPDDKSVVKFKPSFEKSKNKFTSIALTVTNVNNKVNTLSGIKEFMKKYITNTKTGKLISFEYKKEGKRDILVSTMSQTVGSKTFMYKSYIFIFKKKFYNLMLNTPEVDFEENEIILKEMYETLKVK